MSRFRIVLATLALFAVLAAPGWFEPDSEAPPAARDLSERITTGQLAGSRGAAS